MPSTYAHYRMGEEVRDLLSGRERDVIEAFPEPYWIGLHGPDILFYYKALSSNPVNRLGYQMHEEAGEQFFAKARNVLNGLKQEEGPKLTRALSYVYGVLNHFALDVSCHAYVDHRMEESGITHTEIEVEFDRMLMLTDGLDPVRQVLTNHLHPGRENAETIAPFYPGTTSAEIQKAIQSMIFQNRLLLCNTNLKRNLVYAVLKLTGHYESLQGIVVNPNGNPRCEESNGRLLEMYGEAVSRGVTFIQSFAGYWEREEELPPIFDYNFEGVMPE